MGQEWTGDMFQHETSFFGLGCAGMAMAEESSWALIDKLEHLGQQSCLQ